MTKQHRVFVEWNRLSVKWTSDLGYFWVTRTRPEGGIYVSILNNPVKTGRRSREHWFDGSSLFSIPSSRFEDAIRFLAGTLDKDAFYQMCCLDENRRFRSSK